MCTSMEPVLETGCRIMCNSFMSESSSQTWAWVSASSRDLTRLSMSFRCLVLKEISRVTLRGMLAWMSKLLVLTYCRTVLKYSLPAALTDFIGVERLQVMEYVLFTEGDKGRNRVRVSGMLGQSSKFMGTV